MNTYKPGLKSEFDELAVAIKEIKSYNDNIEQSVEPARDSIELAQTHVENIINNYEWFYQGNEEDFDKMLQQFDMALGVCYDLDKNNQIIDNKDSTEDNIEEAEATIFYRRDYFKTHIEGAEDYLKNLYSRGRDLAGLWEGNSDVKASKDKGNDSIEI